MSKAAIKVTPPMATGRAALRLPVPCILWPLQSLSHKNIKIIFDNCVGIRMNILILYMKAFSSI